MYVVQQHWPASRLLVHVTTIPQLRRTARPTSRRTAYDYMQHVGTHQITRLNFIRLTGLGQFPLTASVLPVISQKEKSIAVSMNSK
jgi:hypothetical protein